MNWVQSECPGSRAGGAAASSGPADAHGSGIHASHTAKFLEQYGKWLCLHCGAMAGTGLNAMLYKLKEECTASTRRGKDNLRSYANGAEKLH